MKRIPTPGQLFAALRAAVVKPLVLARNPDPTEFELLRKVLESRDIHQAHILKDYLEERGHPVPTYAMRGLKWPVSSPSGITMKHAPEYNSQTNRPDWERVHTFPDGYELAYGTMNLFSPHMDRTQAQIARENRNRRLGEPGVTSRLYKGGRFILIPPKWTTENSHIESKSLWFPLRRAEIGHMEDRYKEEDTKVPDLKTPIHDRPKTHPSLRDTQEKHLYMSRGGTEDALWQAVIENPYDKLARGVLADYLDETGHPEEATLLRRVRSVSPIMHPMKGGNLGHPYLSKGHTSTYGPVDSYYIPSSKKDRHNGLWTQNMLILKHPNFEEMYAHGKRLQDELKPTKLSRGGTEDALWANLAKAPHDEMARGVLADHLDENGSPEIADMVRRAKRHAPLDYEEDTPYLHQIDDAQANHPVVVRAHNGSKFNLGLHLMWWINHPTNGRLHGFFTEYSNAPEATKALKHLRNYATEKPVQLSRSTSESLWDAFAANPKDEMARMVLADHEDENGRPAVAEMLRGGKLSDIQFAGGENMETLPNVETMKTIQNVPLNGKRPLRHSHLRRIFAMGGSPVLWYVHDGKGKWHGFSTRYPDPKKAGLATKNLADELSPHPKEVR